MYRTQQIMKIVITSVILAIVIAFIITQVIRPTLVRGESMYPTLVEDDYLIVVNKPKGMIVHPTMGKQRDTLVNGLLHHCKDLSGINGVMRPGIVHRIDMDTTGSLIVCKNDKAHASIAHAVPFGIDEYIGQIQRVGKVYVLLHYLVVVRPVVMCPVDP